MLTDGMGELVSVILIVLLGLGDRVIGQFGIDVDLVAAKVIGADVKANEQNPVGFEDLGAFVDDRLDEADVA